MTWKESESTPDSSVTPPSPTSPLGVVLSYLLFRLRQSWNGIGGDGYREEVDNLGNYVPSSVPITHPAPPHITCTRCLELWVGAGKLSLAFYFSQPLFGYVKRPQIDFKLPVRTLAQYGFCSTFLQRTGLSVNRKGDYGLAR